MVYKQIGNAVPVRLALAVARPIAEFAKKDLKQRKKQIKVNNQRIAVAAGQYQQMMA